MKILKNILAILLIAFISMNVNAQEVVKSKKEQRKERKIKKAVKKIEESNETIQKDGCVSGNCKNGFGTFIYPYGDKYIGNWKDGKLNGQGTWINPDKSKYVGEWKNDFYNGTGKMYDSNGNLTQTGVWKKGIFQTSIYESGDCENGWGTYTWEDGNKYTGTWENGKRNGPGNLYWFNGDKYIGDWKNNIREGNGDYVWSDGSFYRGEYKNDMMNGKGKYYDKGGVLLKKGTWINDEYQVNETGCLSGDCENGKGTFLWENGQKYIGEWKNSRLNGYGTLYFEDGTIFHQGQWKNHKKVE